MCNRKSKSDISLITKGSSVGITSATLMREADLEGSPMMIVESFGDHSVRDNSSSSKDLSFGKKSQIKDMKKTLSTSSQIIFT